jgi:hypothetical protein
MFQSETWVTGKNNKQRIETAYTRYLTSSLRVHLTDILQNKEMKAHYELS